MVRPVVRVLIALSGILIAHAAVAIVCPGGHEGTAHREGGHAETFVGHFGADAMSFAHAAGPLPGDLEASGLIALCVATLVALGALLAIGSRGRRAGAGWVHLLSSARCADGLSRRAPPLLAPPLSVLRC